jgi:hypothetical protein
MFGHPKTKLGYVKQHVFHSIRRTGATVFKQTGVPEGVTRDIVNLAKQTVTHELYSGGTSVTQRRGAMVNFEKLMLEGEAEANSVPVGGDQN